MQITKIEGLEDLRNIFEQTLENEEKKLYTFLTEKPLIYLLGEKFSEYYMLERTKRNIFLKSLRCSQGELDKPNHKDYSKLNKEVKVAPRDVKIFQSLILWDDHVVWFDTETKTGIHIQNKKHANTIKSWFDLIWSQSE